MVPCLNLSVDGFEIETSMNIRALRAGLKVAEVPSFESPRVHGVGRLRTIPDGWRVLKTILREYIRSLVERPEQQLVRPERNPQLSIPPSTSTQSELAA